MKKIVMILGITSFLNVANAAMISSDDIGNDPAKVKLCATRANGKPVPFEIDSRYVEYARRVHPEVTFIAIDGISPQLIECYQSEGTGKFGPATMSPQNNDWRLPKPVQFKPGLNTREGMTMAANTCLNAVPERINRSGFDHSVYSSVVEVNKGSPLYHPGASIAGIKAQRYDIAVKGQSFYTSSGPDLAVVNFVCLLSPTLDIKAIQLK